VNALVEKQLPENAPVWSTGPSVTALFDTERAEPEEEEEDEEEEEGDGEYGEEEAGDEYGEEYGEEEEPPGKPAREWPDKDIVASAKQDTRVFRSDEKLR
jgi:hypothetical protein